MNRLLVAIFLGLVLVLIAFREANTAELNHDTGILYPVLILYSLPVIAFIWIFAKDYAESIKRNGSLKSFIPTAILTGLSIVALNIFNYYNDQENAPTLICGYSVSDADEVYVGNEYTLVFKKNGTYYLIEQTESTRYKYSGKYTFKDSTLKLDKEYNFDDFKTDKFLIRVFPRLSSVWNGVDTSYFGNIFLLDSNKNIIDCRFHFSVEWPNIVII